jgi:hypothetical protein
MHLRHPVFLVMVLLYAFLRAMSACGTILPLHGHLTDVLCMPVVLTLGQSAGRLVAPGFRVGPLLAWATCAAFALWFEWLLPRTDPRHTADVLDVACYAAGTYAFGLLNSR